MLTAVDSRRSALSPAAKLKSSSSGMMLPALDKKKQERIIGR
jgi:hypothetical protein